MKKVKKNMQKFQYDPRRFLFFVVGQKKHFCFMMIIFVVSARLLYMTVPFFTKQITDALANSYENMVYLNVGLLLAAIILSTIFYRITGLIAASWNAFMEVYAAQLAFDHLIGHSAQYFANRLSGKLQNKVLNISAAVSGIMPIIFWDFLDLVVKLILSVSLAFSVNIYIGGIFFFFILISVSLSAAMTKRLSQYSWEQADASSEVRGTMVDVVSNILAVKQNIATGRESKNAENVLAHYARKRKRTWNFFEKILFLNNMVIFFMISSVMIVAVYLWKLDALSPGDIIMMLMLMNGLFGDLQFLSSSFNRFMERYGQMREGLEEVFAPYAIVDHGAAQSGVIKKGGIVFDNVHFRYEEDDTQVVFDHLSLTISAGQKIGLVGESGAGKSTFVSLLLRFVEPEDGSIRIDGCDIAYMRQDDLRDAIAYVPQDALLFHRSLKDNIVYGNPNATDEEMIMAAGRAYAREFIEKMPKKYDTLVGERGVKLSGGQKQRIMIARAMLKKSPILVLDEATSALDSRSEKYIQEALEGLMKDRTTIVIAHRLSTLKKMDRIVVFDNGTIVEDGSHDELLAIKGKYYMLWQHQSGTFM